ncbi:hypothetical protein HK097_005980 [Rhizophlyctis rosea]|uniref:Uncharacterized protein n=1 Tax=Rhizophlyctis rosea TaxID=64517 RepID=A0AAD5SKX3_9FUNG|nr:hypothetical protein HK097_005980 [Rhizophlyctis rosea]
MPSGQPKSHPHPPSREEQDNASLGHDPNSAYCAHCTSSQSQQVSTREAQAAANQEKPNKGEWAKTDQVVHPPNDDGKGVVGKVQAQ